MPDRSKFDRVLLSCDPADKAGPRNDYTAVAVIGIQEKAIHILDVCRGHWTVMQMREQIITMVLQWQVDLLIIEDTSSGMGLLQLLREQAHLDVVGRRPDADKETRVLRQQARFESGRIRLPSDAPWLAELETELLGFPHARYDDQVDALLQSLEWYAENQWYLQPIPVVVPALLTKEDAGWPWRPDPWSPPPGW